MRTTSTLHRLLPVEDPLDRPRFGCPRAIEGIRKIRRVSEAEPLLEEVQRPALALHVRPADVFADDAEREELDPAEKERADEHGRPAWHPLLRQQPNAQGVQDADHRE